jgi:hypothetical protein
MNPTLHRLLLELRDWLLAVASLNDAFNPICRHIVDAIESDLRCLKKGLPFDGVMRGFNLEPRQGIDDPDGPEELK